MYFPQWQEAFAGLLRDLSGRPVVLIGHSRPDGDCIGSQVGLARALRSQGIDAQCVNSDPVPRRLQFLVRDTPFTPRAEILTGPVDAAIYLDCADHGRAGDRLQQRFPQPLGNLDHHLSNPGYAACNIVDAQASATAELLAGLWFDQGLTLDPLSAQALYTGIVTDTGQFRFPTTSQRTLELATRLFACGARPAQINFELYEQETLGRMQLLQRFLASLQLWCGGRLAVGLLPLGIYEETGTLPEDAEGLVDYMRSLAGVDIGVLVEGQPAGIKASLRAKDARFRVDLLAREFRGGGHAAAAGLNVTATTLLDFLPQLKDALARHLAARDAANAARQVDAVPPADAASTTPGVGTTPPAASTALATGAAAPL